MNKTTIFSMVIAAAIAAGSLAHVAHADVPPMPPVAAEHGAVEQGGEGHEAGHAAGGHEAAGHEAAGHEAAGHGGGHEDPSQNFNWFKGIPFGYYSLDAKGGPLGDGKLGTGPDAPTVSAADEEKMSAPFILMFVNFGILLLILAKFAGPAARKMAESRSDQIKNALEESAKLRQQASAKLEEYKTKLADADAQINKMVADMRASADADKTRILDNAAKQAEALKRDAEARIAAEIARARIELKREVSIAAAAAAEKMLRERVTGADQTKLVDTFIADLMQVPVATSKEQR